MDFLEIEKDFIGLYFGIGFKRFVVLIIFFFCVII